MTAKEYLRQVRLLDQKINQRIEEAGELRQIMITLRSPALDKDTVQTSPEADPIGSALVKYCELERTIDRMIDEFIDLKHKIIGEIQQLKDARMVELLYLRYIKYMRLEEIACTMRKNDGGTYTYEYIRRLHGYSLKEFSKCHSKVTFK